MVSSVEQGQEMVVHNQIIVTPVVSIQKIYHDFWARMTRKYCWKYIIRPTIEDADFIIDNEMQIPKCCFHYTNPEDTKVIQRISLLRIPFLVFL